MSKIHFVCAEEYRKRVIQLGEHPDRVFDFGALNVEAMKKIMVIPKEDLEKEIKFSFSPQSLLVTYHPVTLENDTAKEQFPHLINAIESFKDLNVIFTKTNADTEGRVINDLIDNYVEEHPQKAVAYTSMGQLRYINALRYVDAVAGNSSSGIIETPTFKVPTVNIGEREKGRIIADNIINCDSTEIAIKAALEKALSKPFRESLVNMQNPYDKENTSINITKVLKEFKGLDTTKKEFYNIPFGSHV